MRALSKLVALLGVVCLSMGLSLSSWAQSPHTKETQSVEELEAQIGRASCRERVYTKV